MRLAGVALFLPFPLTEGKGRGGNTSAVIEEGVKSTKRHLWTDRVVVSPIANRFHGSRRAPSRDATKLTCEPRDGSLCFRSPLTPPLTPTSLLQRLPVKSCQCSGEVLARLLAQSIQNVWKWPYRSTF